MNAILVLPYDAPSVEAHSATCRAAHRARKGVDPFVMGPITMEEIAARKANPDEGRIRVHSCLR